RQHLRCRLQQRGFASHAEHAPGCRRDLSRVEAGRTRDRDGVRRSLAALLAKHRVEHRAPRRAAAEALDRRAHVADGRAIRQCCGPPPRQGLYEQAPPAVVRRLRRHFDRAAADDTSGDAAGASFLVAREARGDDGVESDHQGPEAASMTIRKTPILTRITDGLVSWVRVAVIFTVIVAKGICEYAMFLRAELLMLVLWTSEGMLYIFQCIFLDIMCSTYQL